MSNVNLILGNCIDKMKELQDETIDLVVTSPPYDDLRNYNNTLSWNFDIFCEVAKQLYRVVKQGGCVIWVVGDKTQNGSESGTSFKQALYFKELGFNIHDTMIYRKKTYMPLNHDRYEQEFEYMFCFSKGKPKTFNPIRIPCTYGGTSSWGKSSYYKTDDDTLTQKPAYVIHDDKIKGNIFEYVTGSTKTGKIDHPAVFPLELATDMVKSWSNEGDLVLDCFMGSCTTGVACINLNRNFIGMEIEEKYYNVSKERIEIAQNEIISKGVLW